METNQSPSAPNSDFNSIEDVRLLEESSILVKELAGFQKQHRVPKTIGERDLRYIHEIAEAEIDAELQQVFSALRSAFKFKRKEISVMGPDEGGGVISTPNFNYELFLIHDAEDSSRVQWRRSITGIRTPSRVFCDEFTDVFGTRFRILEIATRDELEIEKIIDAFEDAEVDEMQIDYDKDATWCEIELAASATALRVSANCIRVQSQRALNPQSLLQAFLDVQEHFIEMLDLENISIFSDDIPANS